MSLPQIVTSIVVANVVFMLFLTATAYLILLERRLAAWTQDRMGPNRAGLLWFKLPLLPQSLWGLGQPIADGLKMFFKEDYTPRNTDKALFILAPALAITTALIGWAVVPWGGQWASQTWGVIDVAVANVNIGVIYILAVGSLGVYGVVIGGWAANNKYTFLGGLRATAQMLSYEIPMGICVLCVLLLIGSAAADELVHGQVGYWFGVLPSWLIFQQPLAAVLFFTCILAETNRAPFDLHECEQELVAGFHTEYSSMKFGLYFLGEYIHMMTGAAFFAILFLGGWHLPWLDRVFYFGEVQPVQAGLFGVLLKFGVFFAKVIGLVAVMMWIRWTLPRFRFDQLMRLAWRGMIPLALGLLLLTAVFVYLGWQSSMWLGNVVLIGVALAAAPLIPAGRPVNRRVPLAGSRFSPAS